MQSGIYSIVSPSGGQYIGSAVDFGARWRVHRHHLRKGNHYNRALQRAAAKYGLENLIFRKMIVCRVNDLILYEQRAIDVLKPRYNARPVANSQLGFRHSTESNAKNAAAHRGRRQTEEQIEKHSRRMIGNTYGAGKSPSPETRALLASYRQGKPRPGYEIGPEKRARIVASYLGGLNLLKLEERYKADHRTLRRILIAEGVEIRPKYRTLKSQRNGA